MPVLAHVVQVATAPSPRDYIVIGASPAPKVTTLVSGGLPVLNIYPDTRDGRLLHDVLLFDDQGRPLNFRAGDTDPTRQILTAPDGQSIFNSYPIRFFEPGTKRVANPNAAPPIALPRPFTPVARRRPPKAAGRRG
ncbi:MAG: hypothetical protein ACR2KV_04085 [Solirubrobacteraceae bacterium]